MYQFLFDYFKGGHYPEFLFCNNAEYILTVYEVLLDLNLRPGREVGLAGIATGLSFRGLLPSYTYVKVPMFDMGRAIIRQIATGRTEAIPPVSAPLIVGKSTLNQPHSDNIKEMPR